MSIAYKSIVCMCRLWFYSFSVLFGAVWQRHIGNIFSFHALWWLFGESCMFRCRKEKMFIKTSMSWWSKNLRCRCVYLGDGSQWIILLSREAMNSWSAVKNGYAWKSIEMFSSTQLLSTGWVFFKQLIKKENLFKESHSHTQTHTQHTNVKWKQPSMEMCIIWLKN